jgi:CBS-domain-containing membrane protein
MVLLRVSHPPAGATTTIVSLGIISKPEYLVTIQVAVILLTAQAFVINRLTGLLYPSSRERKRTLSGMSFDPRDRELSEKSAGRAIDAQSVVCSRILDLDP